MALGFGRVRVDKVETPAGGEISHQLQQLTEVACVRRQQQEVISVANSRYVLTVKKRPAAAAVQGLDEREEKDVGESW